ncbi:MAG: phosphatase PAP2 family protein [Oscillospiraceae bacterium]|nr:phosphatase PAP2 family protein [Oscillospiraceae bacterium]
MELLYWLESIRNPFLDAVMTFFTFFGEEIAFMLIALIVFWCVDKKEGYYLLFLGFFGTVLNQFLKLFFRIPRPWVKDPDFTVVPSAEESATGYSFPSGHTQNAAGTLGGIARWSKRGWLRIVLVATLLLTAFSRMYLGVHTLLDVGVSLLISAVLIFAFYPIVKKASENPRTMYLLLGIMVAVSLAFVCYANLAAFPSDIDPENLYEGRKNSFSLLGALLGFCAAYPIERKFIRFPEQGAWWVQIIKVLGGLAGLLIFKEGLKPLFNAIGFTGLGSNTIRYFTMVFFAAAVWPLLFKPLSKLGRKAQKP